MAKFLDTSGLTYLWGKITAALNAKANVTDLANVATSGNYNDLDYKPTFSAGTGINIRGSGAPGYDWDYEIEFTGDADEVDYNNSHSGLSATNVEDAIDELAAEKADASSLATVATTGQYSDLSGTPTIPADTWRPVTIFGQRYTGDPSATLKEFSLAAGNNINIVASSTDPSYLDFEISATDTKPSDFDASTFSVTANNNTTTSFKSKTLAKGIYICVGCAQFASNATGFRSVSFNVNGANSDNYAFVMPAVSGAKTYTQISMILNLTQTSNTVVFQGYQNSGVNSNLAVTGMFETIKIL